MHTVIYNDASLSPQDQKTILDDIGYEPQSMSPISQRSDSQGAQVSEKDEIQAPKLASCPKQTGQNDPNLLAPAGSIGFNSPRSCSSPQGLAIDQSGHCDGSTSASPEQIQPLHTKAIVYTPDGRKLCIENAHLSCIVEKIAAEFGMPAEEQHLLQEPGSGDAKTYFCVERKMDPKSLRFTKCTISPNFRDGRPIHQLLNDLNLGDVDPLRELEPLDVVWHGGAWRSLSNRRLWALKHSVLAISGQPLFVRVRVRQVDTEFQDINTSNNDGMYVTISQSRSPSPISAK